MVGAEAIKRCRLYAFDRRHLQADVREAPPEQRAQPGPDLVGVQRGLSDDIAEGQVEDACRIAESPPQPIDERPRRLEAVEVTSRHALQGCGCPIAGV